MGEQVILSISLLASNRKATIRKCLDSLKPIMEQVSSELIIVDTGCDEETRNILKEYTDHIIPFQWCDDFSAARNAGLKQAKGEWFLYIDDDEWFTDVTPIVDFFQSGEYKEYGLALYIQRNFQNWEGTMYTDDWVSRIIRRTDDTHFVGIIHEYLIPVRGRYKLLKCPASHFGYLFDSAEKMYRRSKRNITLLLKMLEKEKNCIRWWTHLAQEYLAMKEYYNLYDLCNKGIQCFKSDTPVINRGRGTFYVGRLRANLMRRLYEDGVKDYEEAVLDGRNTELCMAALHINGAYVYMQMKQYQKAAECCRKYLKLYGKLTEDDTVMTSQGSLFVCDFFEKKDCNSACCILIICELKEGKDQGLRQYFESLGWEDDIIYLNYDIIPTLLDFWSKAEYDDFYVRAADRLIKRKNISEETVQCLREREQTLSEDAFLRLARIFSQVDADLPYIIYLRILYQDSCGTYSDLSDNLQDLFERQEDFLCLPDKLWEIAERGVVDLKGLFHRMDFDQWKTGVDLFVQKSDIDTILKRREMWFGAGEQASLDLQVEPETVEAQASLGARADMETSRAQDNSGVRADMEASRAQDNLNVQPGLETSEAQDSSDTHASMEMAAAALRHDYFMIRTTEALLIKEHYNHSYEEFHQALLEYVDGNLKLYGIFFNDNAFSGEMAFLPRSCRLAVKLGFAFAQEKDGDHIAVLETYKDCLKIYPAMDSVIRQYVHLYREKMEAERQEFVWLKEQLTEKVRELIDAQAYEAAGLILKELKQLTPEDQDILALEKMAVL
ncbi:MAG: glycosyltransferase [Blautia sp.]|nr:glycosyltransferase [Blautia sp.]